MRVGLVHPGLGVRELRCSISDQPNDEASHLMLARGRGMSATLLFSAMFAVLSFLSVEAHGSCNHGGDVVIGRC